MKGFCSEEIGKTLQFLLPIDDESAVFFGGRNLHSDDMLVQWIMLEFFVTIYNNISVEIFITFRTKELKGYLSFRRYLCVDLYKVPKLFFSNLIFPCFFRAINRFGNDGNKYRFYSNVPAYTFFDERLKTPSYTYVVAKREAKGRSSKESLFVVDLITYKYFYVKSKTLFLGKNFLILHMSYLYTPKVDLHTKYFSIDCFTHKTFLVKTSV